MLAHLRYLVGQSNSSPGFSTRLRVRGALCRRKRYRAERSLIQRGATAGNYVPGSYSCKMARATRNVDIKLQFEQFDMMPGSTGKRFQRNLLIHGGKSDTQGFSITDCFLRVDAFAVAYGQSVVLPAPAGTVAAPGAAPAPAAAPRVRHHPAPTPSAPAPEGAVGRHSRRMWWAVLAMSRV